MEETNLKWSKASKAPAEFDGNQRLEHDPLGFLGGSDGKESPINQETRVPSLGGEDPPEKGMATHSTTLA